MSQELVMQLASMAGVGVSVYAAIRADLARLHERSNAAKEAADKAHERLDRHIEVAH